LREPPPPAEFVYDVGCIARFEGGGAVLNDQEVERNEIR
jgi:hypothetical protein